MKNTFLPGLLLAGLLIASCTSESSKKETAATETETSGATNQTPVAEAEVKPVQKPDSLYSYALTTDPFGVNPTENITAEQYLDKLSIGYTMRKRPTPNRHDPTKTDTIISVNFGSSRILFHEAADKVLLQSATLRNQEIPLQGNLRVGMTRTDLLNRLNELNYKWAAKGRIITVADQHGLSSVKFVISNNAVARIDYEGYVD